MFEWPTNHKFNQLYGATYSPFPNFVCSGIKKKKKTTNLQVLFIAALILQIYVKKTVQNPNLHVLTLKLALGKMRYTKITKHHLTIRTVTTVTVKAYLIIALSCAYSSRKICLATAKSF